MRSVVRALPLPRGVWRANAIRLGWLAAGVVIALWVIGHVDVSAIVNGLRAVGLKGFLAILGIRLVAAALMGIAWWRLRRIGRRRSFVWGRLLRDAGSEILPFSQFGGYLLATRSVALQGASSAIAATSVIADAIIEFCAQITFVLVGLYALVELTHNSSLGLVALCAAAAIVSAVGVVLKFVQGRNIRSLVHRAFSLLPSTIRTALSTGSSVRGELGATLRLRRTWPSFVLHLSAWVLSAIEAWLALRFLGASPGFALVLALESLLYATRSAAFLIPSAVGVQEGAYVFIGSALGLAPELVLSLSLLKRGRDLVLGFPTLLSWHFVECRKR